MAGRCKRYLAASAADHELCAIGVYTHNLQGSPAQQTELMDALKIFSQLDYVRGEDIPLIPVLQTRHAYVTYGPLADAPLPADIALLLARGLLLLFRIHSEHRKQHKTCSPLQRDTVVIPLESLESGR